MKIILAVPETEDPAYIRRLVSELREAASRTNAQIRVFYEQPYAVRALLRDAGLREAPSGLVGLCGRRRRAARLRDSAAAVQIRALAARLGCAV